MDSSLPPAPPPASPPPMPSFPPMAPAHPGPAEGYRPVSGLCVAAFVLSLVLGLAALLTLWPGVLLSLVLALVALFTVDARLRRGRAFAWWALALSLLGLLVGLGETRAIQGATDHVASGVFAALRARGTEAERDALLDAWLDAPQREESRARIRAHFADAVAKFGDIVDGPQPASVWSGMFPCILPPSGVVPVDAPKEERAIPGPGTALWVRVPFEKAVLHAALILVHGQNDAARDAWQRLGEDSMGFSRPVKIVRDVRFFAPPNLVPADRTPPEPPAPPPAPGPERPR